MRLYDALRIIRDKEQKINIKDYDDFVIQDAYKGDVPMKYVSREVFSLVDNDDGTLTFELQHLAPRDAKRKSA